MELYAANENSAEIKIFGLMSFLRDIKGWPKVKLPCHTQNYLRFIQFVVRPFVGVVVKVLGLFEVFMPKSLRSNQKVIASVSSLFTVSHIQETSYLYKT